MGFGKMRLARAGNFILPLSMGMLAATVTGAASAEETMSHRPSAHQLVRKLPVASPTPVNQSAPIKPQAANPNVPGTFKYYGGHVMSNVQIVNVYWGAGGKTAAPPDTEDYFKFIVNSPFMDWLGEYDTAGVTVTGGATGTSQHVNRGTFLKGVTITPKTATSTTSVSDDDIGAELSGQITAGNVPAPQVDSEGGVNTLYNLYFPAGLYIVDSQNTPSCNAPDNLTQSGAFCGYHGAVAMTVGGKKVSVPYSVLPDMFDTGCACVPQGCGCGGTTSAQSAMITASHELTEAMTDPEIDILIHDPNATVIGAPVAWYDEKNGEIGDICGNYYQQNNDVAGEYAPLPGAPAGKGWVAQNIYSQRLQTCLVQDTSLPTCGATGGGAADAGVGDAAAGDAAAGDAAAGDAGVAKSGRPCAPCSSNADCSSSPSTPACETDVTNPKAGTCVACAANADCKVATTPVCEKTATGATAEDTCRGCKADSECAAPAAKCATTGACVACLTDSDCTSTQTCDTAGNTCKDKPVTGGSGGDGGTGGGSGGNGDNGGSGGCAAAPGGSAANGFALGGLVLGLVAFARRRRRQD